MLERYCATCGSRWEPEDESRGCWLCGGGDTTEDAALAGALSRYYASEHLHGPVLWKQIACKVCRGRIRCRGDGVLFLSEFDTMHGSPDMASPALGVYPGKFKTLNVPSFSSGGVG